MFLSLAKYEYGLMEVYDIDVTDMLRKITHFWVFAMLF
jgi:hypothetical protein